ncbi:FkbM family methyltransferase [Bradyrhizobium shewense]|uniref:FkbM family methyltransferase n=1 Tax=Bradyrhizobium shewense TaxID=1761772 RepID=UPI0013F697EC|nr:FkbM family methyltransferase [Bradyrhizobium shewense]
MTEDDIRDADGSARRVWEYNEREAEVLQYINAQKWQPRALIWCDAVWASHNGTEFVQTRFRHVVHHGDKFFEFDCLNKAALARAKSTLTKEPGTIAWIDGFERKSHFWDIGANIGTFSIYAAVIRDCVVTSFEPAAANFTALNRNIIANKLDKKMRALAVAVDAQCKVADLHMRDNEEASALHAFGTSTDYQGETFMPSHLQGALGVSIDALVSVFGMPTPNYVKIDVDGLERAVVAGGRQTFADPQCKSVLVELDLNDLSEVSQITDVMKACGMYRDDNVPGNTGRDHGKVMVYNMIFRR